MNYSTRLFPKSKVEIDVTISLAELEPYVKKAAVLLSDENEIDGFRRGKAPYEVVKNKFGELVIYERAAELAVRKTYPEVISGLSTLTPVGRPEITITKLAPGNELQYKVETAVFPEVKLPDYKKIAGRAKNQRKEISVNDEEVKRTLEWIRESRAKLFAVDRSAVKGDALEIDFEMKRGGTDIAEGGSKNHPLILGRGKFLPGFEEALIGMRAGEKKMFTLTVPPDWYEKSLAGKTLDFRVVVKSVQERQVPELTDDFAKSLGEFSSLEDLKKNIRDGIWQEKNDKDKQRIRSLMAEEIAGAAEFEVPEVMIVSELEKMLAELKMGIEEMGVKWEDHLLHIKKTPDDLKREWRNEAEKRVRIALCLREIAKLEKIEPMAEEVEERANSLLAQYKSAEEAEKSIDPEELREYTKGVLRNEKVFEFLDGLA